MAQQLRVHYHPRQAVAVHRQPGPLLLSQAESQGHSFIGPPAPEFLVEFLQVTVGNRHQGLQLFQRLVQVRHALTHHRQDVTGTVIRQQHAIAIEDKTAIGRQGLQLHPVTLRLGAVGLVLGDLQAVVADQDHAQQCEDDGNGDDGTGAVDPGLPVRILEGDVLGHDTDLPGLL
jgi:hypothetical protein